MNTPLNSSDASEFQKFYSDVFIEAFHLSFYTQLGQVINNSQPQIYRIGLGTTATARCLLQIGALIPAKNINHPAYRTFNILFHVQLSDAIAARSFCETIVSETLSTTFKLSTYWPEITDMLPVQIRETVKKYPVALRITGLAPQESMQDVIYNILETIGLQWVSSGHIASKLRWFIGIDRQNKASKPEWTIILPWLTALGKRGKVTEDIRATLEDKHMWNRAVGPWKYENEDNFLPSKNENTQRIRLQKKVMKKYSRLMRRVLNSVDGLGWGKFNSQSPEYKVLAHITELIEIFIPTIVVTKIIHGKEWDSYQLETGNMWIDSIEITLLESQKNMGTNIMEGISRKVEFVCAVDISKLEDLTRVLQYLSKEDISHTLEISAEVYSGLTIKDQELLTELSDSEQIGFYEDNTARLIISSYFKSQDTTRFTDIIQTIMIALHTNGFPLEASNIVSSMFGFLKKGSNERGWINSLVHQGEQYYCSSKDVMQEKRDMRN